MEARKWVGSRSYEYLVACNREEIGKVIDRFHIDPNFFLGKTLSDAEGNEQFYFFVSAKRKRIAMLPFLAIVFGGQYNADLPYGGRVELEINYDEYELEEFAF